ncbi:small conductance mechanosensitive channel [Nitrosospira sp. Nl5]|uniref:mechanosensitive ion channel family protein n=1 Tax=Nitrosospira sp. Nl5 TaxID=200120 RepID=UPI000880D166|nr:mechanosensitive ion channel family protein [Nitrosospira sp. Nl5]SCY30409.1 small conductance mechanosensitive channel [Nitrosospira sp. Nl5]
MDLIAKFLDRVNWEVLMFTTLRILIISFAAWMLLLALKVLLNRMQRTLVSRASDQGEMATEAAKRIETLVRLLRQAVVIIVWVMVGLVILRELGVEIAPILASAGVVGLAVGFGAQNLVRDFIAGFFMILENQVRVGDVAIVNGTGGLVESINFRTIVLRDETGTVHVFPNGAITTLANMTQEWSAYVFEVGVAYRADMDKVMAVMREVGAEMRSDETFGPQMMEDIEIYGVDSFKDSAVVIKGRLRTRPIKQWNVGREYRRRLKLAFEREGIEIPFPHRTIDFGETGSALVAGLINQKNGEKPDAS